MEVNCLVDNFEMATPQPISSVEDDECDGEYKAYCFFFVRDFHLVNTFNLTLLPE